MDPRSRAERHPLLIREPQGSFFLGADAEQHCAGKLRKKKPEIHLVKASMIDGLRDASVGSSLRGATAPMGPVLLPTKNA